VSCPSHPEPGGACEPMPSEPWRCVYGDHPMPGHLQFVRCGRFWHLGVEVKRQLGLPDQLILQCDYCGQLEVGLRTRVANYRNGGNGIEEVVAAGQWHFALRTPLEQRLLAALAAVLPYAESRLEDLDEVATAAVAEMRPAAGGLSVDAGIAARAVEHARALVEGRAPFVPWGTHEVQGRVTGEEGRSSPREAGGGLTVRPPPASVSEAAASRWAADAISGRLLCERPPLGALARVLRIRDDLAAAAAVPLSSTLETERAGAVPAPESAAGAPPAVPPAPSLPAPEEPGIHGVSCDEVASWVNGDYSGAPGERLRALEDHLHDCEGSCRSVAALRAFERRMG